MRFGTISSRLPHNDERMQKNLRLVPSVADLHHSFKIAVGCWHFLPSVSLNSVGV